MLDYFPFTRASMHLTSFYCWKNDMVPSLLPYVNVKFSVFVHFIRLSDCLSNCMSFFGCSVIFILWADYLKSKSWTVRERRPIFLRSLSHFGQLRTHLDFMKVTNILDFWPQWLDLWPTVLIKAKGTFCSIRALILRSLKAVGEMKVKKLPNTS